MPKLGLRRVINQNLKWWHI